MPSNQVRNDLLQMGVKLGNNNFIKFDTLASSEDLLLLFEVLSSVRDKNGRSGILSPFVNTTNANFEKIINSGFQEYSFEPFTETLKKYHKGDVFSIWQQGIQENIFSPQYHGREHFNVPYLMRLLREGNRTLIEAFKRGVIHIPMSQIKTENLRSLAEAYFYDNKDDLEYLRGALIEGVEIFENIFGFAPKVFGPPNGIFNGELEEALSNTGIQSIVVNRSRIEPDGYGGLKNKIFLFKFGRMNKLNQIYHRRNAKFEPFQQDYSRDRTLSEIRAALRMGKPAIISSHRINYVGSLEQEHRDFSLRELRAILKNVVEEWPQIEFVSSGELSQILKNSLNKE